MTYEERLKEIKKVLNEGDDKLGWYFITKENAEFLISELEKRDRALNGVKNRLKIIRSRGLEEKAVIDGTLNYIQSIMEEGDE